MDILSLSGCYYWYTFMYIIIFLTTPFVMLFWIKIWWQDCIFWHIFTIFWLVIILDSHQECVVKDLITILDWYQTYNFLPLIKILTTPFVSFICIEKVQKVKHFRLFFTLAFDILLGKTFKSDLEFMASSSQCSLEYLHEYISKFENLYKSISTHPYVMPYIQAMYHKDILVSSSFEILDYVSNLNNFISLINTYPWVVEELIKHTLDEEHDTSHNSLELIAQTYGDDINNDYDNDNEFTSYPIDPITKHLDNSDAKNRVISSNLILTKT